MVGASLWTWRSLIGPWHDHSFVRQLSLLALACLDVCNFVWPSLVMVFFLSSRVSLSSCILASDSSVSYTLDCIRVNLHIAKSWIVSVRHWLVFGCIRQYFVVCLSVDMAFVIRSDARASVSLFQFVCGFLRACLDTSCTGKPGPNYSYVVTQLLHNRSVEPRQARWKSVKIP